MPLLRRAYELWRELERTAGERLLFTTGSLDVGAPGSQTLDGSLLSCRLHDLTHELLSAADVRGRFPGYGIPDSLQAVLQPDGGFVLAERSVEHHVKAAVALGATVRTGERVLDLDLDGDRVTVRTDRGRYRAPRVVVTAGPWAGTLVPSLAALAKPERQVLLWTGILRPGLFDPAAFPVFNLEVPEGRFYGFPEFGVPGFKIGKYHHRGEPTDPDRVNRDIDARDEEVLREALRSYFPGRRRAEAERDHLPVHQQPGRTLHPGSGSRRSARRDCGGIFRARVQVLQRRRRDRRRPRDRRRNGARHQPVSPVAVRRAYVVSGFSRTAART